MTGKAWEVKLRQVESEKAELQAQLRRLQGRLARAEADVESVREEADAAAGASEEARLLRVRVVELETTVAAAAESRAGASEEAEAELAAHWERQAEMRRDLASAQGDLDRLRHQRSQLIAKVRQFARKDDSEKM